LKTSRNSTSFSISRVGSVLFIVLIIAVSTVVVYFLVSNNIFGTPNTRYTFSTTATNQGSSGQSVSIPCGGNVWLTYHCEYTRDGVDNKESSIRSPSVSWTSQTLDGDIYAEPLVAFGKVFVATENDSIYALNASTGSIVWRTNVGTPVTSGLPCGDINPLGITGTPVIDLLTKTIYLVGEVVGGAHYLFGLNTDTGSIVFMRNIDPPGSTPIDQQQRAALALNDGIVYVAMGGLDGDCGNYHGWVVGAQLNDSSKLLTFEVASASSDLEGGIWEVGGTSISSNGNLYIATGNSRDGTQNYDYGDGVIQLSPTLQVLSYFAPADYQSLNQQDTDLGSTGPILLGNSTYLFQIGKEGVGYILNKSNLGGFNAPVFSAQVCNGGYSADSYYDSYIYVPCSNGLMALKFQASSTQASFSSAWNSTTFTSGAPIVSGGAVWTIDTDSGTLFAFDPASGATLFSYNLGSVVHFESMASADGKIFVGANDQIVAISIAS
jgi:outer membrane protein assembly factor BamB